MRPYATRGALSPLQAALLRGFARKKLAEQDGTYTPLIGDTEKELAADDDQDWFPRSLSCSLSLSLSLHLSLFSLSLFSLSPLSLSSL